MPNTDADLTSDQLRCPVHGIPDCSPMLNGCSRVINAAKKDDARSRHLGELAEARLSVACQTCGAPSGEPCKMPRGKRADTVHESRYRATLPLADDIVDRYHTRSIPPASSDTAGGAS